jgi:hypothetical protein
MKVEVKAKLALIRMLPMLTCLGFPPMSRRFPLAPFTSGGSSSVPSDA